MFGFFWNFNCSQNNQILKSQDHTPHLPTSKAYPTPGKGVGSIFSAKMGEWKDELKGTRSNYPMATRFWAMGRKLFGLLLHPLKRTGVNAKMTNYLLLYIFIAKRTRLEKTNKQTTRISRFSGFTACGWNGSMDDWVRIPTEPWGFAKMCYSSKWPQRMYFRLPIWLRSLSFWFWGDRETSRGDDNYPLGRTRAKTK